VGINRRIPGCNRIGWSKQANNVRVDVDAWGAILALGCNVLIVIVISLGFANDNDAPSGNAFTPAPNNRVTVSDSIHGINSDEEPGFLAIP
jgi:hypothetical protein